MIPSLLEADERVYSTDPSIAMVRVNRPSDYSSIELVESVSSSCIYCKNVGMQAWHHHQHYRKESAAMKILPQRTRFSNSSLSSGSFCSKCHSRKLSKRRFQGGQSYPHNTSLMVLSLRSVLSPVTLAHLAQSKSR